MPLPSARARVADKAEAAVSGKPAAFCARLGWLGQAAPLRNSFARVALDLGVRYGLDDAPLALS